MFYNTKDVFNRFTMMLSTKQVESLFASRVLIFGMGGVGGSLAHMLVRSGIQNITIVDFDVVDVTNINRQLIANVNNIGQLKVDELEKQLLEINPELTIKKYPIKLSETTINLFNLQSYDYVIDCIDDINAKKLLIKKASMANVRLLCAMGAGNRFKDNPHFEIADISKTSYDKIAKIIRKFCAEERIKKLSVCYTKQKPLKFDSKTIGSVVYYPISMAATMCSKIINDLIER